MPTGKNILAAVISFAFLILSAIGQQQAPKPQTPAKSGKATIPPKKMPIPPLQPELDRIVALQSKDELAEELAHLHTIDVNAFFGYGSDQDYKDATSVIAEADQGGLGLPERDYYTRTDAKSAQTRRQYIQH